MISIPAEVALVHGPVKTLAGKRLAVERLVGIAVEEAADLVFKFAHALGRPADAGSRRGPGAERRAAGDRVHEMPSMESRLQLTLSGP